MRIIELDWLFANMNRMDKEDQDALNNNEIAKQYRSANLVRDGITLNAFVYMESLAHIVELYNKYQARQSYLKREYGEYVQIEITKWSNRLSYEDWLEQRCERVETNWNLLKQYAQTASISINTKLPFIYKMSELEKRK